MHDFLDQPGGKRAQETYHEPPTYLDSAQPDLRGYQRKERTRKLGAQSHEEERWFLDEVAKVELCGYMI
jgi:hypothetical protein